MKLFIKDGIIVSSARDKSDAEIDGCEVKFVPDSTNVHQNGLPVSWHDLGITDEEAADYEARLRLRMSDASMGRVMEDLIVKMIDQGIINKSILPDVDHQKITHRQNWRSLIIKE
jgi:hypothetical protein